MHNNRIFINFGLIIIGTFVFCTKKEKVSKKEAPILSESLAFEFVLDSIIGNKEFLYYNDSIFFKAELVDEITELIESKRICSNGVVCELTEPINFSGDSEIRRNGELLKETLEYEESFRSIKEYGFTPFKYPLPDYVKIMNWEDYKKVKPGNSVYITVRHPIESKSGFQIEVNVTSAKYVPNSSEFTFSIFLNAQSEIENWFFSIKDEFDKKIDCEF